MPSSHLIRCRSLLLLIQIPPIIRDFYESTLRVRWPKYWSFSFSISLSKEHPRLVSLRMDWWDLLAVQGTLKSLLQHHSSKASFFWHSAFFTVQISYQYMTTGKTIALTRWTFIGKVMSLFFKMRSKVDITFPPRSKCLLISWLQSPSAVILGPKNKAWHCFHCFPIYSPWCDGTRCHDLRCRMLCFKPSFSLSCFTFIKRLYTSSSFSAISVVLSAYLRLLTFLLAIWTPVSASSSLEFLMMYSAFMSNKQGSNMQPDVLPFLFGTSLLFHVHF